MNVPWFFRIGFLYYSTIAQVIVILVGYPVSILTGGCDDLDERLLAPFIRQFYKNTKTSSQDSKNSESLIKLKYQDTPEKNEKELLTDA